MLWVPTYSLEYGLQKTIEWYDAIGTNLKDAYILTTQIYEDNRGSFKESFNLREVQKIIGNYEFVQDCHSTSVKNVVRGLHYQIQHSQERLFDVFMVRFMM